MILTIIILAALTLGGVINQIRQEEKIKKLEEKNMELDVFKQISENGIKYSDILYKLLKDKWDCEKYYSKNNSELLPLSTRENMILGYIEYLEKKNKILKK